MLNYGREPIRTGASGQYYTDTNPEIPADAQVILLLVEKETLFEGTKKTGV